MKKIIFIASAFFSINAISQIPNFNAELGLHPLISSYSCTAGTNEQADMSIQMLLNKSNYEWAKSNCGENLNDVEDAAKKVAAQNKYLERFSKGCYSAKESKALRDMIAYSTMPGTTCNTPAILNGVRQYKKSLEIVPKN